MARQYTTVVVRCEDLQQRCFVYRYLTGRGVSYRLIDIRHCPSGRGDARRWVQKEHVREVGALRTKPHLSIGLITMIDADAESVDRRKKMLDEALRQAGQGMRSPTDPIAVLVPRRNIETWIHCLRGATVNETDRYPRFRHDERQCVPAVREFLRRCPAHMKEDDPSSLKDACQELTRFLAHHAG